MSVNENNQPMNNQICSKCGKSGILISGHFPGSKQKQLIMEHGPHNHCLLDSPPKKEIIKVSEIVATPEGSSEKLAFGPTLITDKNLAKLWGKSLNSIKDSCNPNRDPYYSSHMFNPEDVKLYGKGFLIKYFVSLNPEEDRPRIIERDKRPKRGNPNLGLGKKFGRQTRGVPKNSGGQLPVSPV